MILLRSLEEPPSEQWATATLVGFFDGVHLGHQRIVQHLTARAAQRGLAPLVITFPEHPLRYLNPSLCPPRLSDPMDKVDQLASAGVEVIYLVPFDCKLANTSAEEFCSEVLAQRLGVRLLISGPDFALGKRREGRRERLKELTSRSGIEYEIVPPEQRGGTSISSTRIRHLLAEGDVATAAELLGRPHLVRGEVVAGQRLGTKMGFPTLNVLPESGVALPAKGVYVVKAGLGGEVCPAVVNVGSRPTVGGGPLLVEVHVLDRANLTPVEGVKVQFLSRLREERTFASLEELKTQIERDVVSAREYFTGR